MATRGNNGLLWETVDDQAQKGSQNASDKKEINVVHTYLFVENVEKSIFSLLKKILKFVTIKPMKTLYDVQQFLKQFGIIIYLGKRLYDIELMRIELKRIYDAGLMDKLDYFEAEAVLRREYKIEQEREQKQKE